MKPVAKILERPLPYSSSLTESYQDSCLTPHLGYELGYLHGSAKNLTPTWSESSILQIYSIWAEIR